MVEVRGGDYQSISDQSLGECTPVDSSTFLQGPEERLHSMGKGKKKTEDYDRGQVWKPILFSDKSVLSLEVGLCISIAPWILFNYY